MTSFLIFAITLTGLFAAAMTVLTLLAVAAQRRDELARQARQRRFLAGIPHGAKSAEMYTLAERRKATSTEVTIERRRAA